MNALGSDECSSGCESGWTLYLDDHSSNFNDHQCYDHESKDRKTKMEDSHSGADEEDDLSMLSDASSGPPHFPDHFHSNYFNAQDFSASNIKSSKVVLVKRRSKKRQKVKTNKHLVQDQHNDDDNDDDDTASSPLFDFSMNNITVSDDTNQQTSTESSTVDYSQGFSATYFEERSSLQLQGFLQENEAHRS